MADLTGMLQAAAGVSTGNPNAWDISKAYYDPGADAGDLSKAVYSNESFSVAGQEANPGGIFFKPDGTKMYITGSTGDDVNEYNLSVPWMVASATYLQVKSVSTEESSPQDVAFKPDGTKMYIVGVGGVEVNEYTLSTAWDVSSASYVQNFSVSAKETGPGGLRFKPDGTKMYVTGTDSNSVHEYDLSTPWNISTASFLQSFSVAGQETNTSALDFALDGTKMYIMGASGDDVNEYDLSTAWDVSSATYVQNFSVSGQDATPRGLYVRDDGGVFYMCGVGNDTVYQYVIGGFSVATQETSPTGLYFKTDGTKMYVTGTAGDDVNEYDLSTPFDLATASFVQTFSVGSQSNAPRDLFFDSTGTRMYITDAALDQVFQYTLSTGWDVSSASYVQFFGVATQESYPSGVHFKPDGTKMYICGYGSAASPEVNEYDLSTAWDISTASAVTNYVISAEESEPEGLFFKDDGTEMYIAGENRNAIFQYTLSTPWDISSASYASKKIGALAGFVTGLYWSPDGEQMFIVEDQVNRIFKFLISEE